VHRSVLGLSKTTVTIWIKCGESFNNSLPEILVHKLPEQNWKDSQNKVEKALDVRLAFLVSDDCEAPEIVDVSVEPTPVEELQDLEDAVQDGLDELTDNRDESAFIEMDKTQRSQFLRRFLRGVGVFFLLIFFLLACVATAYLVGSLIGGLLGFFLQHVMHVPWRSSMSMSMEYGLLGSIFGLFIGVVPCIYNMVNTMLPRLQ